MASSPQVEPAFQKTLFEKRQFGAHLSIHDITAKQRRIERQVGGQGFFEGDGGGGSGARRQEAGRTEQQLRGQGEWVCRCEGVAGVGAGLRAGAERRGNGVAAGVE